MSKSAHVHGRAVVTRKLSIAPRAPFRLDLTAWALRRRAHNAIDRWDGRAYSRALELNGTPAAIALRQVNRLERPRLALTLTGTGIGQETEPLARAALARLLGSRSTSRHSRHWHRRTHCWTSSSGVCAA